MIKATIGLDDLLLSAHTDAGTNVTDYRWRRYLSWPGLEHAWRRAISVPDERRGLAVDHDALLVNVLHVSLEMRLLLELLRAESARVLVVSVTVNSDHMPA